MEGVATVVGLPLAEEQNFWKNHTLLNGCPQTTCVKSIRLLQAAAIPGAWFPPLQVIENVESPKFDCSCLMFE